MEIIERRPVLATGIAFALGFFIGLVIFGWNLTPVQYSGALPQDLLPASQAQYLRTLADVYSFDLNQARARAALIAWPEADVAICQLASRSADPADAARLIALATVVNGIGCVGAPLPTPEETDQGGFGSYLVTFFLALLLLVLLVVIYMRMNRRSLGAKEVTEAYPEAAPAGPVATREATDQGMTPVARFQTTFVRGHDTYDDSFSIENTNGDFLGECGVGISEAIGVDSPKNVTAFEVWLFDKNDIRTITKVIMSDHAFFDEAIKAKLAPKGEPVLARPNETIVLETASLIINAEISEMEYGSGQLPPRSFFERFTVELSAWAKTGDVGEPEVPERSDEMLDF